MDCISSGIGVWKVFYLLGEPALPFKLPYRHLMNEDAVSEAKISSAGLLNAMIGFGLRSEAWTDEEFDMAYELQPKYLKLSVYDIAALAIAKCRHIVLLTDDMALREAAKTEEVTVKGTLKILDELFISRIIAPWKYRQCLVRLLSMNGQEVRMPEIELIARIERTSNSDEEATIIYCS